MILKKVTVYKTIEYSVCGGFNIQTVPYQVTFYLFGIPIWRCTYISIYPE